MKHVIACVGVVALVATLTADAFAQPRVRTHVVTRKGELHLIPATTAPAFASEISIEIVGDERVINTNGIPNHKTGRFPNRGNPNRISPQSHVYRIPAEPKIAGAPIPLRGVFGVAVNGVPFDPGAAEFFAGASGWQYEPLSGAIDLGIDASNAHVQPGGNYHYHGLPTKLLEQLKLDPQQHSPLVGWAADGFPIYAVTGYRDPDDATSGVKMLTSSYRLKEGLRPGGREPEGPYDGTFVADYEYVAGSGDLDECNGRQTVTPEFPEGTYAYFLTANWPVIPRMFRGTPSADFDRGPRGQAEPRFGSGPRPGQILPEAVREELELTEAQKGELAELQEMVEERLTRILSAEQRKALQEFHPERSRPIPPRW
jgi:hypothetical protein